MGIAALNKAESKKATQLALRHMARVEGVTQVNVVEGYVEVKSSRLSGVAMVPASINQTFIDNCINKESPQFKEGEQLYDDYHKFYIPVAKDEDNLFSTDRNWMIKIIKHKNFFSTKYDASSWLWLGNNYQYCIGHKEGLSSLEQVFEHLCYSIEKIPRG
jgi:hypothetical protein